MKDKVMTFETVFKCTSSFCDEPRCHSPEKPGSGRRESTAMDEASGAQEVHPDRGTLPLPNAAMTIMITASPPTHGTL